VFMLYNLFNWSGVNGTGLSEGGPGTYGTSCIAIGFACGTNAVLKPYADDKLWLRVGRLTRLSCN
jgi:hypothetical protein